ncbi:DUF7500 family protein [Halobaculum rubrum]|uniref:DUF7500 family protein n=1 Tax=Halobaculum rubrum TaxID=2872158 RepID=UPI001CA45EC6|nr:hypothetical protein [Halobaculum rubrum]QZX98703.1 hypothetical protein K6T25_10490 [Halobaculum rubrum]
MSDADDAEEPDEERPVRDVVRVDGPDSSEEAEGDGEPPVGRDGVMDPDELDIRGHDGVDETDDGRYVISTGGETHGNHDEAADSVAEDATGSSGTADFVGDGASTDGWADAGDTARDTSATSAASANRDADGDPLDAVAAELDAISASHGFALAVAAGGETDSLRVASGEPTDSLATALRWYARRVNPDVPAEETIRELLAASDLDLG